MKNKQAWIVLPILLLVGFGGGWFIAEHRADAGREGGRATKAQRDARHQREEVQTLEERLNRRRSLGQ